MFSASTGLYIISSTILLNPIDNALSAAAFISEYCFSAFSVLFLELLSEIELSIASIATFSISKVLVSLFLAAIALPLEIIIVAAMRKVINLFLFI
ncbi:hypothetical protein SDC9_137717 [bioreactor metagenome]|uniref:Uncharacterized protein n=1 Tax=bioreactor metagenome TaxID=1076179 RepID=A0A645DMQ7_9ZZZZ